MLIAGADQGEPGLLRAIGSRRAALHGAAQVARQRRTLAHRKYAGLLPRMIYRGGDVAGGVDPVIAQGLQGIAHQDKAALVQLQARLAQPRGATGLGDPDNLVGIE